LAPVAALPLLLLGGCEPDLDTTRTSARRPGESFGAVVYGEACQRVAWISQLDEKSAGLRTTVDATGQAYAPVCLDDMPAPADAPRKLQALQSQRAPLVAAVDVALPKPFLDPLESFLEAIVPLDDDGTMEKAIRSVATVLQKMIDDPAFGDSLARMATRLGYRPLAAAAGVTHALLAWPGVDDALASMLDLLLDDNGAPGPELTTLLTVLSKEMAAAQKEVDPAAPERTLRLALDLLLAPSTEAGDGTPRPVTVRDATGVAVLASGSVPAPFVDNGDGRPWIAGADGKPVTRATPFPVPGQKDVGTTRDAAGRLLDGNGQPVFTSIDLDGTVLSALTREAVVLLDPNADNALGLLFGAGALLGPRDATPNHTKDYQDANGTTVDHLQYRGFDTDQSSLLDLAHAYLQLLGAPRIQETLRAAKVLLSDAEDPTSRSLAAMLDANDRGKKDMNAHIPATSIFYDELVGHRQMIWKSNIMQLVEFAPILLRVLRVQAADVAAGRRGLVDDMLDAMQDPHTSGLALSLGAQMLYKDAFVLDQDAFASNRDNQPTVPLPEVKGSWSTPVDRTQPDVDIDRNTYNRSVMQRMAHLIHDSNNTRFCNKQCASVSLAGLINVGCFDQCKMFEIDDLALFFALAIARDPNNPHDPLLDDMSRNETTRSKASFIAQMTDSTLVWAVNHVPFTSPDDFLQGSLATHIPGFTEFPTPQAAARSLFLDQAHQSSFMQGAIDSVTCSDGDNFIDVHNDSIFSWEVATPGDPNGDNFYAAVRPLMRAFVKHDECLDDACSSKQNAVKIFLDLMALLHEHWGTPRAMNFGNGFQSTDRTMPRFATGDGMLSYEPLLGDILGKSDLVPSMINLSPTLQGLTVDGNPGLPALLDTAQWVFDPKLTPAGLTYRIGGATTTVESDGVTPVPRATPYYLLADAYAKKRAQLAAAPDDQQGAWRAATATMVDEMLTVDSTNGHKLKNRLLHGVTLALVDYLLGRLQHHADAGDLDDWIHTTLIGDLAGKVGSPTFAALVDLTAKLEGSPQTLAKVYAMLQPLVDAQASDATFTSALTGTADLLQVLLDDADLVAVAHTLASVVDPASGATTAQLSLLKKARALDPNRPMAGDTMHSATLIQVLRNMFQETPNHGPLPISTLGDAIGEVNRCLAHDDKLCAAVTAPPATGSDFVGADYRHLFGEIQSFLVDEERGFTRFIAIVKNRGPATSN
jgi:hypothetical protein